MGRFGYQVWDCDDGMDVQSDLHEFIDKSFCSNGNFKARISPDELLILADLIVRLNGAVYFRQDFYEKLHQKLIETFTPEFFNGFRHKKAMRLTYTRLLKKFQKVMNSET